jgi:hypothetical protein
VISDLLVPGDCVFLDAVFIILICLLRNAWKVQVSDTRPTGHPGGQR